MMFIILKLIECPISESGFAEDFSVLPELFVFYWQTTKYS